MTAASRSLATALWGARFASGLLQQSLHHRVGHNPPRRGANGGAELFRTWSEEASWTGPQRVLRTKKSKSSPGYCGGSGALIA